MEGAAVAHVAARYGLPAMEIRGISSMVEKRDPFKWEKERAELLAFHEHRQVTGWINANINNDDKVGENAILTRNNGKRYNRL